MKDKTMYKRTGWLLALVFLIVGCTQAPTRESVVPTTEETAMLLEYLEGPGGNLINDGTLPTLVTPEIVLEGLTAFNQLVVDLRPDSLFAAGHIAHAVNLQPEEVLHYFEQIVEPTGFDRIVLVCSDAMLSAYVNGILRLLGHANVYTLRNGMSAWSSEIAEVYWLPAMSAHMEGRLETTPHPKNQPGTMPAIATGKTSGYEILRARAANMLKERAGRTEVTADELMAAASDWYIVNYWPADLYNQGHITGSVQYGPRTSMHSGADLFTLPAGERIAVWCYTGHTSAYVTAFLNLLGYDAYNVPYGANSFIHDTMKGFGIPTRTFDDQTPRNYPLVKPGEQGVQQDTPEIKTEIQSVEGGC